MTGIDSARLELRLTYAPAFSAPCDVLVRAGSDATIAELAQALAAHAGHAGTPQLYSERTGALPPDLTLDDGLVRDGDVLRADAPRPPSIRRPGSGLEACIVGGPGAGRRIALPSGPATIGRSPDATVCIDDPSLSRHHARLVVGPAGAAVADDGSRNGTSVDGKRLAPGEARAVGPEDHVEVGRSLLQIRAVSRTDDAVARRRQTHVDFNRMPRMANGVRPARIEVEPPPARPAGARLPLAASAGPLVLGVVMFLVVHEPTMLLFSALTPVMAVTTFLSDRRSGRRAHATRLAGFRARARDLEGELEAARDAEIAARRASRPDPATLAARALRHLPALWERRRTDDDFLVLRLGTADQPAALTIDFPDGGEPREREPIEARIRATSVLPAVPLDVDVLDVGGVGLVGDPSQADALARWLVVQAAVLHSPRELIVCAALSEERAAAEWAWLAWLPHAAPTRTVVDHANVAVGGAAAHGLLLALAGAAELRHEERQQRFSARARSRPVVLLLLDEAVGPSRALVDELLADAAETDVAVLWLGRHRRDLPGGCAAVVELADDKAAMDVTWPREGRELHDATPDGIDVAMAEEVARALAPVRDVTQSRAAGNVPRSAPLLDVLGITDLSPAAVLARWAAAAPGALATPLGRSADGPLSIDLRRDGPHALVAGTTGAGKSELLQSLVAGLAAGQPPTRVGFLFVDYKGGTAFKDCVRLPHSAGMVTDLDEHLTRRALLSLNAELRRREHVLNAAGAKDLAQLERRDPEAAPPSLVIVVDEFAALKAEVPEFVDGLIDIAQRGRSLGVHLILATQRPGGVVSDNIRANTNLRIALRVQEPGESDDVIGDRAAARISKSVPGRAFAKTGHSELTEFQSSYGGGRSAIGGDERVSVTGLRFGEPEARDDGAPVQEGASDLERLVDALDAVTRHAGLPLPSAPWREPLPPSLSLKELGDAQDQAPHVVPLGRLDDPRRQRQATWSLDLERDGSVLVYGTSGSGKTTLLRTVAVQLARRSEPRHLHLYGLDFAGHGLSMLSDLPHCGDVIAADDEERVARLLAMLLREIDERGRRLAARGVATLAQLHAVSEPADWPPRIVVLLDSYAGFTAAIDQVDRGALTQMLPRVIADGRAAGVHVIATADRRNAVPQAVTALVSQRVVLRLAAEDEYVALGLDRKGVEGAVLPAGRGFVDETLELQIATVAATAAGDAPAQAIREEAARLVERHGAEAAPAIPRMPTRVARATLPAARDALRPLLGVEEAELGPVAADVSESAFFVCGPYRSGRTTALAALVASMLEASPALELHLLLPRRSALASLPVRAATVARGTEQCLDAVRSLQEMVAARSPDAVHAPCVIVIDDVSELADGAPAAALEAILRRGRDVNVRVLAACETGQARSFSPVLRELRKDGNGLLLEPSLDMDGELLGVRLPRRTNLAFPPGRGFLVSNGVPLLVQVAEQPA